MQATVAGVTLHYEVQGDGPPIVLVHGLGGTSNVWHAQRVTLSRTHRVVTYDLSGSGLSDRSRRQYSIATWAEELVGLMDHVKLDSAALAGHSMGTVIVQLFAARHPQRVSALILAGALTELAPPGKEAFTK